MHSRAGTEALSRGTKNHKQARAETFLAQFFQEVRFNVCHEDSFLSAPITNSMNHSYGFGDRLRESVHGDLTRPKPQRQRRQGTQSWQDVFPSKLRTPMELKWKARRRLALPL